MTAGAYPESTPAGKMTLSEVSTMASLIFVAAAGFAALVSLATSTPAAAQSCQQRCEASYPNAFSDPHQRRGKAACLRRCSKGGKK